MRAGVYLTLFAALSTCRTEPKQPPPIILISIDTLRSDRLPAYGYKGIQTPHIDQLAADGIVFEHAFAHVPLTLPSHATLFTGLLPPVNGVRDNAGSTLDPKLPTIATELRARGYATGAAVSAYVLRKSTGIGNGFDAYDDRIAFAEGAPTGNLQRAGAETVRLAKEWIATNVDAKNGKPFFAFVHLFEPHAPYEPTYDADVVKSDALVGDLLDALRERGLYDDAMIVLVSDHGEGLMDHGEQEHGVLLYREALQVPLIVKLPQSARRGTRVQEAIGLTAVKSIITNNDLRTTNNALYAETLYPRIHLGWSELRSMIRFPLHLIDGPKPELYDLSRDLYETENVRETRRREYAQLQSDLAAVPQPAATTAAIDPEEAKKLAALGYLSARPSAPSNLNPRDHLGDLIELKRIARFMRSRELAAAAKHIEDLLKRNPGWSDLRDQLGVAYEAVGDLPSAERAYRDAIRTTPELAADFALSLAPVLLSQGKIDDADAHARLALRANPPAAHELLGHIALARGDLDSALREAALAKESPQHALSAEMIVAHVHVARRELPQALTTLQAIHEASGTRHIPLPPDFFFLTGDVFARMGRLADAVAAFERQLQITPGHRAARERLAFVRKLR